LHAAARYLEALANATAEELALAKRVHLITFAGDPCFIRNGLCDRSSIIPNRMSRASQEKSLVLTL